MSKKHFLNGWIVALFLTLPLAFGANQQSWVSSTGSDANDCTRAHPCATFQGALAKTALRGAIGVVDPGDYGPVDISTAVTIDGGGMGRINGTSSGVAVDIRNGAFGTTIENLAIDCGGAVVGISALDSTLVEKVVISHCGTGINSTVNTLSVRNSLIHDGGNGVVLNTNSGDVKDTTFINLMLGILATNDGTVTVDNCFFSFDGKAVFANGSAGVVLSNSTITQNTNGLVSGSGGTITSFVNNRIINNVTDGAPTKSVFQK